MFTNYLYSSQENKLISTKPTFTGSTTSQKTITASFLSKWDNDTLTKDLEDLIINSWAQKTRKQYKTYFGKWEEFCQDHNFSSTKASITEGLEFLLMHYKKGLSYSVNNTVIKSILPMILPACNGTEFGKH